MRFNGSKIETNLEILSTITYIYILQCIFKITHSKWCTNYIEEGIYEFAKLRIRNVSKLETNSTFFM